ncbi:hypothetical protein J7E55_02950 [Bacillus sp. ISL-53]|nr:hypothetical protein [Bacillus sp. ISL-53]
MRKKIGLGILTVLSVILLFGNISEVLASSNQIDAEEKAAFYKLDLIQDVLEVGDNEITYYWKDSDGVEQSVDLIVTLDDVGTISSVKEINVFSDKQLEEIQESIKQKDTTEKITTMASDVPYKLNGGSTSSQFVNSHAFDRHKYLKSGSSTCSRTRYAKDVGVKSLRLSTVSSYDEKFNRKEGDNSNATYYNKQYKAHISQSVSPNYVQTKWHRVTKINGIEETHHPLCK